MVIAGQALPGTGNACTSGQTRIGLLGDCWIKRKKKNQGQEAEICCEHRHR